MVERGENSNELINPPQEESLPLLSNGNGFVAQNTLGKSKKEALRIKKQFKKEINGNQNGSIPPQDPHPSLNSIEDEENVAISKSRTKKEQARENIKRAPLPFPLEKITSRPPYISVAEGCKIVGNFGHGTAFFKRPLIEGDYYLELSIREDAKKEKKAIFPSAVRIGICPHTFDPSFPLGFGDSIAYKSSDGSIIKNGERIQQCQKYKVGDSIGVLLKVGPPNKHSDPQKINENSSLSFFKNGKFMARHRQLKHAFYCFGVSLFNYSQVEVLGQTEHSYKEDGKSYFESLTQKVVYKDLENRHFLKI